MSNRVARLVKRIKGDLAARNRSGSNTLRSGVWAAASLDDDYRTFAQHFTPAEIVELTASLALFMGFSKIAIVLGQEPKSMPTTVVPTPDWPT